MLAGRPSAPLFTLFGVPVYVDTWYALPMVFFGAQGLSEGGAGGAFLACLAVTVSLLVHEFGHVCAAAMDGHRSVVVLRGFGGATIPDGESRRWRGVRLSLAGPAAGLALWAVTWFLFMPEDIAAYGVYLEPAVMLMPHALVDQLVEEPRLSHLLWQWLVWINLAWTILNLMPVLPLDGGHALRDLLRVKLRAYRADVIADRVGLVVGAAGGLWFFSVGMAFAGVMFLYFAWEALERARNPR